MKRDFTPENFEDFLKRSADGLRMKAPDRVWQNLSKEMGRRRRRFLIGLSSFLLITSTAGYYIINNVSEPAVSSLPTEQNSNANNQATAKKETAEKTAPLTTNQGKVVTMPVRNNTAFQQTEPKQGRQLARVIPLHEVYPTGETTAIEKPAYEDVNSPAEDKNSPAFSPTVVDTYSPEAEKATQETQSAQKPVENSPLTVESVINAFKAKSRKSRFETQFYFAPTISYRKLAENKSYLRSLDPNAVPSNYPALYSSVSSNVTHKPDVGFEMGIAAKYVVSKNLKIRTGLQFNVNRYDVRAFSSPLSVATIALNNGPRVDSFNTFSSYSNVDGYKTNWLQNLSFQVSAPVGLEWLFGGSEKTQFGIATTVQPTYILGDRAYLITTDYKNYTEVPWLIRRWNVNTAFETFVTYQGAKTKWQIGPQVRYQLLSSFISKYPVKENLFDFGLRVGISLNK